MTRRIAEEVADLRARVERLEHHRCFHRYQPPPETNDHLETLLGYIFQEFDTKPWAVSWVIESSIENPLLLGAIIGCLGRTPTVKGLSRFLGAHLGRWGDLVLHRMNPHSEGVRYCLTVSLPKGDRVTTVKNRG